MIEKRHYFISNIITTICIILHKKSQLIKNKDRKYDRLEVGHIFSLF